jgi:hypothetical protein
VTKAVTARNPKRNYIASNARVFGVLTRLPAGLRERAVTAAVGLRTIPKAAPGQAGA